MSGIRAHDSLDRLNSFIGRQRRAAGVEQCGDLTIVNRLNFQNLVAKHSAEACELVSACREARVKSPVVDGMEDMLARLPVKHMRWGRS